MGRARIGSPQLPLQCDGSAFGSGTWVDREGREAGEAVAARGERRANHDRSPPGRPTGAKELMAEAMIVGEPAGW